MLQMEAHEAHSHAGHSHVGEALEGSMLGDFFDQLLHIFIDMAPFMVLGLLFVGILNTYIKKEWITRFVGKDNFASVIKASVIGIPLPLCSCGVVPTALEMKKGGAGNGAVVSFLTSTPQTGIEVLVATYGMLGPFIAIYRAIAAFITGIIGGAVTNILGRNDTQKLEIPTHHCQDENCSCHEHAQPVHQCEDENCACHEQAALDKKKFSNVFTYPFISFLDEISFHLLIGLVLAAAINAFVPVDFFVSHGFDSGILAMLLMLVISLPMYLCSTSAIPIALTLIAKGISPGAAFVFLFVGPATNIASLVVLAKSLGKKVTIIYIVVVAVMAIIFGLGLDLLGESIFHYGGNLDEAGHNHAWYTDVLAIIFGVLLIWSLARKLLRRIKHGKAKKTNAA